MLSSVVIAALAVAPAALAARPQPPSGYEYTEEVQNSKAKCVAKATAYNFKSSRDAHVNAGM
jgi:hypothetical protein